MHFSMVGGCQSVDIFLLLPPPAAASGSHFCPGCSEPPGLPLREAPSPPPRSAKFHVCPRPQGTLFKFTLGQLCSKRGPVDALPELGVQVGERAGLWGRNACKGLGGDRGSWEQHFGVLHLSASDSPEFCSVSGADCSLLG